jgi:hypothetical protein
LPLIYALSFAGELLLLWASVLWSFVTCCSSSGLCRSLLRLIVAWLYRFWRLFMLWRYSRFGFWIIIFFCSFAFLQMQCYWIRFAFEGGVKEY